MKSMNMKNTSARVRALVRSASAFAWVAVVGLPGLALAQVPFATAEKAGDAMIEAVAGNSDAAFARLLGKDWRALLPPGGVALEDRKLFTEKARQAHAVKVSEGRAELVVGPDAWTLPIPIVQGKDGQWRFDPRGGRAAVLERQIGANELSAMQASLAYLDAQREYAEADRNGDGMLEYAQKMISSPGKRDGLIWSVALGDDSPLGEAFLPARPGLGYHGYHFKVLTGQGPKAKGGERSYLIGKRMVSGYALLAWPVKYGTSGVMSFMVNQDGQLFQRDLGPQTAEAAKAIKRFNPDDAWTATKP